MALEQAKNSLMGGGKKRHSPLDRVSPMKNTGGKKRVSGSERIVAARGGTDPEKYKAYKAAGGKLNATQAARIGYKTPAESAARLKTSTPESGDGLDVGYRDAAGKIIGSGMDTPIQRKKNPKRDSAKKAAKGKASAQYYSYGLTDKKSPAKRKKK